MSTEPTSSSEVNIISSESSDVTPAAKRKKQSKFMELLSDVIGSAATSSAVKTCEEKAKFELQWYVDDSSCDSTVNPLRWWYDNKPQYPNLCRLALHYLMIPATSVPSEREFSLSGHTVRVKTLLPLFQSILSVFVSVK